MTPKRKYIILLFSLAFIFVGTYVLFENKVREAKKTLDHRSLKADSNFKMQKENMEARFTRENPNEYFLFSERCELNKAISFKDSTVSFFVYSKHFEVKLIDIKYLDCVYAKAESDAICLRSDAEFQKQLDILIAEHGQVASTWAKKLGKSMFMEFTKKNDCSPYFSDNDYYTIHPTAFSEFDRFLAEFKVYENEVNAKNSQTERLFQTEINKLRNGLSSEAKNMMDNNITKSNALKSNDKSFTFEWKGYGHYTYALKEKEIDHDYIEQSMEEVYEVQYRDYSLTNGSMPYSYCYGRSNSGGSGVRVNAGSSDVLVTIKDMNDRVIRHAYIKANRTFTLNVSNGNYNVYFYYGTGWNPKRFMKDTDCGRLVGGFLRNESVSKDPSVLRLYDGIMVYTLTSQVGGNFNTAGSSKMEAF
jgi:hypothetical protein